MEDQNNQPISLPPHPPVQQTPDGPIIPPVGGSMSVKDGLGLVIVALLLLCFLIPGLGILGFVIALIGCIAAGQILKDASKVSKGANIAVKFFKVMAAIGIAIVTVIVGGIAFFFFLVSTGHFDVGS